LDPELARIVNAWPALPESSKAAIGRIVRQWTHDGKPASGNAVDSGASDAKGV
jgi:hypothetical protein